ITNEQVINEAQKNWQAGRVLEAGRVLYEHLPERARPGWAANVLALAKVYLPSIPEVEAVLMIAQDPDRWLEARSIFQSIRTLTLKAEREEEPQPLYLGLLSLAENTAKITYNSFRQPSWVEALDPPRPRFDADSGWWIASN